MKHLKRFNESKPIKDHFKILKDYLNDLSDIKYIYIDKWGLDHLEKEDGVPTSFFDDINIPIEKSNPYYNGVGLVDISEYISNYFGDIKYKGDFSTVFSKDNNPFAIGRRMGNLPELSKDELAKIEEYESKLVKGSGKSDTLIGEIFRAFRYIEYRAGNDGDCYYAIGSPSFKSYLFTLFAIDMINDKLRGDIEIENKKLDMWFQDSIHWDGMLFELDYIKLILIELLERKIIDNPKNNIDSRDFK